MGDSSKFWSEGPLICNVDPKVMPHFSFLAQCNYCGEMIPFTSGVERDMRKHYNTRHRLYCKACKKGDFSTREELDRHLSAVHKDGICFICHVSFKLPSAVAMHAEGPNEGPRNECAVPRTALVNALRYVLQAKHNGVLDPETVYSPVSCCSGDEHTIQKLREFNKILLLAHEKAFSDMQDTRNSQPAVLSVDQGAIELKPGNASCVNMESPEHNSETTDHEGGCDTPEVKRTIVQISNRDDIHQWHSLLTTEWTCSTCVDAKFSSLSKLLQHVEKKVRNSWWMSIHQ